MKKIKQDRTENHRLHLNEMWGIQKKIIALVNSSQFITNELMSHSNLHDYSKNLLEDRYGGKSTAAGAAFVD